MKVSVVICTYDEELIDDLYEAVESVLGGHHEDVEVIVVIDGNDAVYERVAETYGDRDRVRVEANEGNRGLSVSRNRGIEAATGEVVAFLDDDAVADDRWLAELVSVYEETNAIAVGGRMVADWVAGEPNFLPEEFYWLVGVTHPGFAEPGEEVRNTFGSNISVRREVLEELDGFDPQVGRRGSLNVQAEEPVLGERMRARFGRGVVYNPDAVVMHKVFEYRTEPRWLLERAFWQGYSKFLLRKLTPSASGGAEASYLTSIVVTALPRRLGRIVRRPSIVPVAEIGAILLLTTAVGFGFAYGALRWIVESL